MVIYGFGDRKEKRTEQNKQSDENRHTENGKRAMQADVETKGRRVSAAAKAI